MSLSRNSTPRPPVLHRPAVAETPIHRRMRALIVYLQLHLPDPHPEERAKNIAAALIDEVDDPRTVIFEALDKHWSLPTQLPEKVIERAVEVWLTS